MTITAKQNTNHCPPHPGEIINDMLDDLDYSVPSIAQMLGISNQHLQAILAARKSVSPDVAARLGKLFGNGPGLWLRLQAAYDAWHAEHDVDVSSVPSLKLAS